MHVVLSIGGSSVVPDGKPNIDFLGSLAKVIKESRNSFGIVVGGGTPARMYATAVRELGAGEFDADQIAVMCTKTNAKLVLAALGEMAAGEVLHTFDKARDAAKHHKVVVMGGTIPGITTDSDAALLAEAIGATRLVNISNVEAIYESDPKRNPKAKKFETLSYAQLITLATECDTRTAGTNFVFDMLACRLIARSGIEAHFVSWKNINEIKNAIEGKKHGGTVVK
jgi:uridylate kinase